MHTKSKISFAIVYAQYTSVQRYTFGPTFIQQGSPALVIESLVACLVFIFNRQPIYTQKHQGRRVNCASNRFN
uniref:Uncharacterized protein n=1 Tax=Anguilla anguilla TaxID=7936 RepID=A0A0E9QQ00_ANGAN